MELKSNKAAKKPLYSRFADIAPPDLPDVAATTPNPFGVVPVAAAQRPKFRCRRPAISSRRRRSRAVITTLTFWYRRRSSGFEQHLLVRGPCGAEVHCALAGRPHRRCRRRRQDRYRPPDRTPCARVGVEPSPVPMLLPCQHGTAAVPSSDTRCWPTRRRRGVGHPRLSGRSEWCRRRPPLLPWVGNVTQFPRVGVT